MTIEIRAHQRLAQTEVRAAGFYDVEVPDNKDKAVLKVTKALNAAYKVAKQFETQSSETPGGPDSSKFKAQKSGDVVMEKNRQIYDGGLNKTYQQFLRIGGAIPHQEQKQIRDTFMKGLKGWKLEPLDRGFAAVTPDGARIIVGVYYGTNWGGIGITVTEPDYLAKRRTGGERNPE